jgi:predicted Mrr-cat superfamily restriction endonuclease
LAKAEEEELYSDFGKKIDLANQHKVTYLYKDGAVMSVPRNNLSEGLQRRLRVPGMSVSDLSEFSDEIDKLFEKPESYSFSDEARIKEDEMQKEFKSKLLSNIQYGKTNLQTGGIGMENLIKELFECEGYEAKILAKTTFKNSADADIEAWRDDAFLPTRKIYAQVKHHSGTSGSTGIDQVIGAIKDKNDDYFGVFITSASVSDEDRKYAEANNIIVKDGNDVVDLIFSNLDKLSIDTKRKLGIVMVPSMII